MCESHDEMVPIGDSNSIGSDSSSALLPATIEKEKKKKPEFEVAENVDF